MEDIRSIHHNLRSRKLNFSKWRLRSRRKQNFGPFLLESPLWHTPSNNLLGSTRYFDNHGGSYKTISLTPERLLKTQNFEKNQKFQWKKNILASFSRIIDLKKRQVTIWRGINGTLTSILQAIWWFLSDLRSPEPNFSKKTQSPVDKSFWFFSETFECDKPQETIFKCRQNVLKITVKGVRSFPLDLRRPETNYSKCMLSSRRKKIWPLFSQITQCRRHRVTLC